MNRKTLNIVGLFLLTATTAAAQNRVGNIVMGRAKAQVLYRYDGSTGLPRPDRVVIQDFATEGEVVTETSRFRHHHLLTRESDEDVAPEVLMQQLRDTFAKTIMDRLEKEDLTIERIPDVRTGRGPELVISGEFLGVNQGNARKRIMIGLGRGASDIKAHVVLSLFENGRSTVLLESNISSQSGKEPGALESTGGVGIAAGTVVGSIGDKRSSTVHADAVRMGKLVAEQAVSVMRAEKWLAQD